MNKAKPFCISKWEVGEAYKQVRANQGAAGIDGQSIADFEVDLKNHLFRIWNRMSSGSYFPPPVRRVDIPKGDGRMRPLRDSNGRRPHCPDGGQTIPGANFGEVFPSGLVWVSAKEVSHRGCGSRPSAVLAARLGP